MGRAEAEEISALENEKSKNSSFSKKNHKFGCSLGTGWESA